MLRELVGEIKKQSGAVLRGDVKDGGAGRGFVVERNSGLDSRLPLAGKDRLAAARNLANIQPAFGGLF